MVRTSKLIFSSLFNPMEGLPKLVVAQNVWAVLVVCSMACLFGNLCFAWRLDVAPQTIAHMDAALAAAQATESDLQAAIAQSQRIAWVLAVAKGLFWPPFCALGLALVLRILAWLLDMQARFVACFCAAAGGLLPLAVWHMASGFVALSRPVVYPEEAGKIITTSLEGWAGASSAWQPVLSALDGYALWVVLCLGFGFAAATRIQPWKGLLWSLGLYVHHAAFTLIIVPAAMPTP